MGLWIEANVKRQVVSPNDGKYFSLEELQKYVGGYVERIDMFNGNAMYVDEEGRLKNLTYNEFATKVLSKLGALPCDYIRGNALIVQNKEEG